MIPFNKPYMTGRELSYIAEAHANGHLAGNGQFSKRCCAWLEERIGSQKALLTHSCTAALEMAAILSGVGVGDEVIMPSFTFVSTANAFVLRGATPVFVDVRPDTLNIDVTKIEAAITPRTKAIVPVHYAGVGCDMDEIMETAARHDLVVIEDAAQGLLADYRGRPLGSIGHMAALSFHETKNIISGEGGALLINDPRFVDRAEVVWEKGTNRSQFFRGQVDKYTWVDLGSSFLPSDLLAAVLCGQLEERESIQARRGAIWARYRDALQDWSEEHGVKLPTVPEHTEQPFHLFYLLLPSGAARDRLIAHLRERRILAVFHYVPLHLSPMGTRFGGRPGDCPVTERISACLVRLPFYNQLSTGDQDRVIEAITDFVEF